MDPTLTSDQYQPAVIEAYSGQIEIDRRPGQGSRFTVKLPALTLLAEADSPGESQTKPRRILIVDDEPGVALIFQKGLEKLPNCEIVTATEGRQALRLFEQQPFDLLITDYRMPRMDGLTLAGRVRQLYPQTIIIIITAQADDRLRGQAAGMSIQHLLEKPVSLAKIRATVLEAIAR